MMISTVMLVFLVNFVKHRNTELLCCFRYHRADHMLGETGTAYTFYGDKWPDKSFGLGSKKC